MNTKWLNSATNEELLEQLDLSFQQLTKTQVFTPEHRELFRDIKLIKEEILKRMK